MKPLSEKHHILVHFNASVCYNNRTNDVRFFGKSSSFALTSNSNSIKLFSGTLFKFLGQIVFGNSNFLGIKIRGATLFSINSFGQLIIVSLPLLQLTSWFQLHNTSTGIFCLNQEISKRGFLLSARKNVVKIWTFEQKKQTDIKIKLINLRNFPSGKICAAATTYKTNISAIALTGKDIFLIKNPLKKNFRTLEKQKKPAWALDFSKDEKILIAGLGDGTVILFSVIDEIILKKFQGDGVPITCCFFSMEGSQVFCCNQKGQIKIWKIDKGVCINTIANHKNPVWSCDISSNEDFLISGCERGTIVIMKDLSSEISKQKKSNFSLFIALQRSFGKKARPNEDFRQIFQKILDYRDPILLIDSIKFFSKETRLNFWNFFPDFFQKLDLTSMRFFLRSMLFWSTKQGGIFWVQQILSMVLKTAKFFFYQKIDLKLIKTLVWIHQKWVCKLRNYYVLL